MAIPHHELLNLALVGALATRADMERRQADLQHLLAGEPELRAKRKKKRHFSVAARRAVAAGQKRRWERYHAAQQAAQRAQPARGKRKPKTMSASVC